jgi:integrase
MASIDKVATGYRARWRAPDGSSRSKTFARKGDAQRHLTGVEHSRLSGGYVDPSAGRVTFRAYAEQWRAVQVWRPRTAEYVENVLRLYAYPRLGERPLGTIRRSDIQALVKVWSEQYAPSTIQVAYRWTATAFKAAVADRVIASSPCVDIALPAVSRPKIQPWPTERVEALADAVPARYRALVVLGAGTGVRISEALAVTTDRVDWMRRTLEVDRQLVDVVDGEPRFGPVKDTKNRPRTIPLADVVLADLVEHVRRYGTGPEGVLFTTEDGCPLDRDDFGRVWRPAARRLDIPAGDGFHQLRHYFASLLIAGGASITLVQDLLGHASLSTTQIYAHLFPDSADQARAAVERVLGARVSSACHEVMPHSL